MSDALEVVRNDAAGRFEVRLGDDIAFAEFRVLSNGILFPHTEVPPAFEGKGVGSLLVRTALSWARAEGKVVMPVCPFFAAYIAKHAEWHDIVHPQYRRALGLED
ncbi:MAG: N-acetyltransferase [Alphaproteobacteria bacterium]|nr:N-acetyltransferase [Alphaproteobacteria bacterium]